VSRRRARPECHGLLEVGLLGPVEVRRDGRAVPVPGLPQRTLLARLALSPGRPVPVTALVDLLWPDDPPANAVRNLHSYVSRLRRVTGDGRVTWGPGGYRLDLDDTDVRHAERLVAEADDGARRDSARAAVLLTDALGLWRGEPLADLPDRLALTAELARLREWRRGLQERRLELLLDTGQAVTALPELEQLARIEPLRERPQLLLMRALHHVGRTADALETARRYRRRLADETGLDPTRALADLEQRLRTDDPRLRPPDPAPGQVAAPTTPGRRPPADRFVGRGAEIATVRSALRHHAVVSVVGPGGVGKTRLVLELLASTTERPVVVDLAAVTTAADVAATVGAQMGLRAASVDISAAIAELLGTGPVLLVLDNCEHVLDAARDLIAELRDRCPGLTVLATSRRRLGVPGEQVVRLGPLPEPDRIALFCDRAALLRDGFEADRPEVREICALLDGLPLAVELAARREAVFGLRALRDRLAGGLQVLEPAQAGDRTTALVPAAEWSYRLLDPAAQALFDRSAVAVGGFDLTALDHLAPEDTANPAALLAELVETSMVLADHSVEPPRYRLLEPLRQVGLARLAPAALAAARAGHTRWMSVHVDRMRQAQDERSPAATALLRREMANLRAALTGLVDERRWTDAAALAVPLAVVLTDDAHLELIGQLRRLADAAPGPPEVRARCALAAGGACWMHGDVDEADRLLDSALGLLPTGHPQRWVAHLFRGMNRMYRGNVAGVEADADALLDDPAAPEWAVATAVCDTALIHVFTGGGERAERWMSAHAALLDRFGAVDGFAAYTRGEMVAARDPEAALHWFEQAYRQCAAAGHTYNRDVAAVGRAAALLRTGRRRPAADACRQLIRTLRSAGMWPQVWTTVRLAAELLADLGDPEPAATLLAAADADPLAPTVLADERVRQRRVRDRIARQLPDGQLAAATHRGATLGRSAAADLALTWLDTDGPTPSSPGSWVSRASGSPLDPGTGSARAAGGSGS
jgi:predicted ATPase/DNA-binding SARP family transcriptional activator